MCIVSFAMPYRVPLQGIDSGHRTLAIVDGGAHRFSNFFESLRERGHNLQVVSPDDSTIALKKFGEILYDNIIIFAPSSTRFGAGNSGAKYRDILDLIESGVNVLIAVDGDMSDETRNFAASCGIDFDEKGTQVIDHFSVHQALDRRQAVMILWRLYDGL